MKYLILSLIVVIHSAFSQPMMHYEYKGSFQVLTSSSEECDSIFNVKDYNVLFFLVGPTYRTVVLHFKNEKATGFLNGISMVGLLGYSNDFLVSKELNNYKLSARGLVNYEIILMKLEVRIPNDDEFECVAEYTGFGHGE